MDRKEQILEIATELVQSRGYSAFSYQDLSNRLGITKASIHHHFPSKEELGRAIAERYSKEVCEILARAKKKSDDPWVQLEGYLKMVLGILKSQDRICAAGSVQSEINVVPEMMSKPMCELVCDVIDWISDVIEAGRDLGVMDYPGNANDQAALIFSAAQGAMQFGRAQNRARARRVLEQIKEGLKP